MSRYYPGTFLAATVAYCALLLYLSSLSSFPDVVSFEGSDKVAHFLLFAGLSAVVSEGLRRAERQYSALLLFAIPTLFSVLYGMSDEAHQLFVAQRTFALGDMAADGLGAAFAAAVLLGIHRTGKSSALMKKGG
jgi:VanZ family protein